MKRLSSPDSLGAYMSICPNSTDEQSHGNNPMYTREFQTILEGFDEEGCVEESGHVSEKKRRLSVDQVKALEKNFEVENKLEPERKVKLAQELGLQPRQVAIWFQNRRARWKTKQLERDYGILKANFDALKNNFETLQTDNEALLKEIEELKSKVNEDGTRDEIQVSHVKEEPMAMSDTEEKNNLETPFNSEETGVGLNFESFIVKNDENVIEGVTLFGDLKDGSSDDSDSSAILNEENNISSPIAANSSNGILHFSPPHQLQKGSCSSMNISFQFSDTKDQSHHHQTQFVKIEEHNFIGEDSCSTFFSEEQAPTLHWYDWN